MIRRLLTPVSLLALVLLCVYAYHFSMQAQAVEKASSVSIDYFAKQVNLKNYNEDGSLSQEMRAKKFTHSSVDSSEFDAPDITIYRKNEPSIRIIAEHGTIPPASNVMILTGKVRITQAQTTLLADKVIAYTTDKKTIKEAIAYGTEKHQVTYTREKTPIKPAFFARANKMTYFKNNNIILLDGNGFIKQNGNSFAAEHITYDYLNKRIISKPNNKGRTVITLHSKDNTLL